jgi:predicted nuclease with RNAse H fold
MKKECVVGIDVGGPKKGFHAVALRGKFFEKLASTDPAVIAQWCLERNAGVVAVDAPCGWSKDGSSRQAEREMNLGGKRISCYATTTRKKAVAHAKGFWNWVLNGERLYRALRKRNFQLFDGSSRKPPICFETFPHAIVCAFAGRVVPAQPKLPNRRQLLMNRGYNPASLGGLDFVDAAICALAAMDFRKGRTIHFGNAAEGFIVIPIRTSAR